MTDGASRHRVVRAVSVAIALLIVGAGAVLAAGHRADPARPLPHFAVPGLRPSDAALTSDAVRGQQTVLLLWASWCEPCQQEIPAVAAAVRNGQTGGVRVIAIDTNDRREDALAFLTAHRSADLPSAFDDNADVATALGLYGLPGAVFVAADGTVTRTHIGPVTVAEITHFG